MQQNYDDPDDKNPFLFKCIDKRQFFGKLAGVIRKEGPAPPFTEEQLKGIFRRYDTDRDGRLNKQELTNAFNALGSRLPGFRAGLALNHANANGDGFIDQNEFDILVKYVLKRGYTVLRD